MKKEEIRVAVVGCGAVANEAHLPAWRKVPGTTVVATCDSNERLAKSTAVRWRINHYYPDFATMLNSEKPSLVDICTPPGSHLDMISQAMKSGCNVIVEKPLAMTSVETRAISDQYLGRSDPSLKLGVLYNWLFHPQVLKLMRHVEKGDIGDVLAVEIKCLQPKNELMISNPNHWCHTLPGGRLGEVLIHPIYLLHRLLGDLRPGELHLARKSAYPWVLYDELSLNLQSSRGFGSIYISFSCPGLEFPIINIFGSRGQLMFNGHNLNLVLLNPANNNSSIGRGLDSFNLINKITGSLTSNTFRKLIGKHKSSHEEYFRAFVGSLNGNTDLPVTIEEIFETNNIFLEILGQVPEWQRKIQGN